MKKIRNTLYVTTQGAYLSKEGEAVAVRVENKTRLRVPIHSIGGIVCFGQIGVSPFLMGFAAEKGVTITFLTLYGRFLARVEGPVSGNVLLRRAQYRRAEDTAQATELARSFVVAKALNARRVLLRGVRDHGGETLQRSTRHLAKCIDALRGGATIESLRGLEGDASRVYFSVFENLISAQKEDFVFAGRSRRPPRDRVNCLLSFVYTLLVHDIRSALESTGLDPQTGFLHQVRPGRPSLALDLLEEFRAPLADRLVLSLINLRQVQGKGFEQASAGGVTMRDDTRKVVLSAYQKRKLEEIEHPFLGEKVQIGLLFAVQARLLARFLREDLDGYPPFLWK